MSNPTPSPNSNPNNSNPNNSNQANLNPNNSNQATSSKLQNVSESVTPFKCVTGALISGVLGVVFYFLTRSIMEVFANTPLPENNLAARLSSLVRSLVIGVSSMGTMIFGIVTVGLIALAIQLLIQRSRQPSA